MKCEEPVIVRADRPDGTGTAPAVCVVANERCSFAPSTRGLDWQHVVYGQSVASPTLDPPADGWHFGYIRSLESRGGTTTTAVFDPVAHRSRGRARRTPGPRGGVERPLHPRRGPIHIRAHRRPGCTGDDRDAGHDLRPTGDLKGLLRTFSDGRPGGTFRQGPESQYWLTTRAGNFVAIEEQYTP